jgi:predicted amidohydrolase
MSAVRLGSNVLLLLAGFLPPAAGQTPTKVRVGLFSAVPEKWDLQANWQTFERTFLAHAAEGMDIVVTPECFLDGYAAAATDWTRPHFEQIAQDVNTSPYIARVRQLAEKHKTAILFGFTEKSGDQIYNCALLVDRNGRIAGHYHKTHLQAQDLRFNPGIELPVFDMAWGKTGVLICADRRWPETARVLRLKGAGVILIPSYGMWSEDNEWWMRTRSYENENFVAFVHPRVAFVSDPKGKIVAKLQSNIPAILSYDIDLAQVSDVNHIRDRRPELYEEITKPR